MTDQDPSVNPADDGVSDEDEAAIDEALDALTATATLDDPDEELVVDDDDDEVGDDEVGDDEEFEDEPDLETIGEVGVPDDGMVDDTFAVTDVADVAPAAPVVADQRLEQLEIVAQALTAAAVKRDDGRIRRKVSASATGAALAGAIPVILQLAGAFELSPQLSAAVAAAGATLASFLSGYLTPERPPTVQPEIASQVLKQP